LKSIHFLKRYPPRLIPTFARCIKLLTGVNNVMINAFVTNAYNILLNAFIANSCSWCYCIAARTEAIKDLQKQIEDLISSRSVDVSKALEQQSEEIDFLRAELTSTKVRLHDALSHSQAEKDALIRHADASRAELMQQLEELRRQYRPVGDTERQFSGDDVVESLHISLGKCHGDEALCSDHVPGMEAISSNIDNGANLWKKFELLSDLVKSEKEKWNVQQTDTSDSDQLDAAVSDGTTSEVAQTHKIRSSWVVLEEQVLPLIEKFCTSVNQDSVADNGEAVINRGCLMENTENGTLLGDGDGKVKEQDKNLQPVIQQLEEEKQEVIRLKEVINEMQDSMHLKVEAVRETEAKYAELQVELDSVCEQLQSQEKLTESLSADVESSSEQLKLRMAELSDKDTDIQKLNAELTELKGQITQKLLVLQAECDEKLDSERNTWQTQIGAKTDDLSAKCAELEQKELTMQALSDQCSILTAERDAKTAELVNSISQIDSLTSEINVVMQQIDAKTDELSAKCSELEQHELTIKSLSDQCSILTAERDAKTAELVNSSSQLDSLTSEISVVKEQLNDKSVALLEAKTHTEHERKLLKDETDCETLVLKSKITALEDETKVLQDQLDSKTVDLVKKDEALTLLENRSVTEQEEFQAKIVGLEEQSIVLKSKIAALEDEIRALQDQLESRTIDLVKKDEALSLLENRRVVEQEEFQAKIAGLEDQLSSDQKSSVEQLDALMSEVKMKESALREHEEEHAAYCKLTDAKLAEVSAVFAAKEDEMKYLVEHHKAELLEKCDMSNEEIAKLSNANEEQLAHLNSQISILTTDKHDLESELQLLKDKLKFESENVARLEKEIAELLLAKEECERQLEDLHSTSTGETEQKMKLQDEQITALTRALSDRNQSLSLLTAALSQTCREDIQSVDSSSRTVVCSSSDAEVLDVGSGDADQAAPELHQLMCAQHYDVVMLVQQINSLHTANAQLQEKIGRLEAELLQISQTDAEPVAESLPEHSSSYQPPTVSHSSG